MASAALALVMAAVSNGAAMAQTVEPRAAQESAFDIPAGPLGAALLQVGAATGVQFNIDSGLTEGRMTAGLRGRYTVEQALAALLSGTGLTYRFTGAQTIVIEALPDIGDARLLGAVRVEGAGAGAGSGYGAGPSAVNGINGSNDVTATEGTGSFTTGAASIASKLPRALKDTPQSISIVTSQQLDEQNINSVSDLMERMPGISVVTGDAGPLRPEFFSRGFQVQRAQIDGGAPIDITTRGNQGLNPLFDMAIYDHAEILRGADGLFNGYGDPGGVISLTRKRPLDQRQVLVEAQVGSWNDYRGTADITGPLTSDGKLRARGVLAWQDSDFFYDTASNVKWTLYGAIDYDLTPTTLVNGGISKNWQRGVNFSGGLPRYLDGGDIGLPRDTCFCFSDSRFSVGTLEYFGRVEQKIGSKWSIRANFTRLEQDTQAQTGSVAGSVNTAGMGPLLFYSRTSERREQTLLDLTLTGGFRLFGHDQRVVIGGNYSNADGGGSVLLRPDSGTLIPVDIFNFNQSDPAFADTDTYRPSTERITDLTRQIGAYATLQLTVWTPLHLEIGLRYSKRTTDSETAILCSLAAGCQSDDIPPRPVALGERFVTLSSKNTTTDFVWPPNASAVFDVTRSLSVYGSYSRIFSDQSTSLDTNLRPLEPVTGNNIEAGVKWAPRNGRVNASLSVYRIRQRNFAFYTGYNPLAPVGGATLCCYTSSSDNVRQSKGIDAEITGEVLPAVQVAASYTYNANETQGVDSYADGQPLQSRFPAHIYKLWVSYQPRTAGWLGRLNIAAGVNGQSSNYTSGRVCPQPDPSGGFDCPVDQLFVDFVSPGYAVASARIAYKVTPMLTAALNAGNLFDKRYYQTIGSADGGNWYGQPRSIVASLSAKF
jgi:outer membrane receptor for ferric coprogen and ferric-rhodotorulic acid